MFSREALVYMANGTHKQIDEIKPGDYIMNKLYASTKVLRIHKLANHPAVEVQLNNGTGTFFCPSNVIVYSHHTTPDGKHRMEYTSISDVHTNGSKLKSSIKSFSPNSDVDITTYNDTDTNLKKDLYCLHLIDTTGSYIINGIITLVNRD